jgi:hypothetical protein
MLHTISEGQTHTAYSENSDAPDTTRDQGHRQSHRNWSERLLRALSYCSTVAPVPFVLLDPREPEDFR